MNRVSRAATLAAPRLSRFDSRRRNPIFPFLTLVGLALVACQGEAEGDADNAADAADTAGAANPDFERQRAMVTELGELNTALAPLLEQAQLDPDIKAKEEALSQQVDEAMEALTPGILEAIDRFEAAQVEFAEAQLAGEPERISELTTELQGLQARIQQTQRLVQIDPEVTTAIAEFRTELAAWMRAHDQGADTLLNRIDAIVEELDASIAAGSGG